MDRPAYNITTIRILHVYLLNSRADKTEGRGRRRGKKILLALRETLFTE